MWDWYTKLYHTSVPRQVNTEKERSTWIEMQSQNFKFSQVLSSCLQMLSYLPKLVEAKMLVAIKLVVEVKWKENSSWSWVRETLVDAKWLKENGSWVMQKCLRIWVDNYNFTKH